jgi:predicted RNase H-like nuclease (RuvC/YqgF family)
MKVYQEECFSLLGRPIEGGQTNFEKEESHIQGQRHAASVLMPEIERLEEYKTKAERVLKENDLLSAELLQAQLKIEQLEDHCAEAVSNAVTLKSYFNKEKLHTEWLDKKITQLEKALEESKAIAQKHEGWLMQEICVRGGLDEKVEGLTKALDLAVKTLEDFHGYLDVSVEIREIKKIRGQK